MKAFVDQDTCIACGMCVSSCNEVFEFNDDAGVFVRNFDQDVAVAFPGFRAGPDAPFFLMA